VRKQTAIVPFLLATLVSGCASQVAPSAGHAASATPTEATTAAPTMSIPPQPTKSSAAATGTWTATGNMITARGEHTATLLPDGKVLVAGGIPDNTEHVRLASAELYDPSTGTWSATGAMATPRSQHTATLLANGKVLVAGGLCQRGTPRCPLGALASAELYDPRTGTWTATGSMTTERYLHTATLLKDGSVLVTGAEHNDGILASAEIYDPAAGKWTATGSMITARTQQMATLLPGGKVLVVGGVGPISPTEHDLLASAELFDPGTGKWTATGSLITRRAWGATATLLRDGHVIVVGGDGPGDPVLASAELYDPTGGSWTATGSLITARDLFMSTLLADGKVLVAGGFQGSDATGFTFIESAELFDPKTGSWTHAGDITVPRIMLTATLLADGRVLVAGGLLADGVTSSAELYDPASGT
jgi:N-acetylneuraminic acid mutarotase